MKKLKNVHPGQVLKEELLEPLGMTQQLLAEATHLSHSTVSNLVNCKQSITPDIAIRLSKFFGTSHEFWLGLQHDYDVCEQEERKHKIYRLIRPYKKMRKPTSSTSKLVRC